jgi:hypothetical protein
MHQPHPGFARALTALIITLTVAAAPASRSVAEPPSKGVQLPDTPAGRCAAAYIGAFNSGEDGMRDFLEHYRSAADLKKQPMDERIERYSMIRGAAGSLTPLRITHSAEREIILLARTSNTDAVFQFRFELGTEPPGYLALLQIDPADPAALDAEIELLDDRTRHEVVASAAEILRETYVDPELGAKMADTLKKNLAEGRYDGITNPSGLSVRLTDDLYSICGDKHLAVRPFNPPAQDEPVKPSQDPQQDARENYGFRKVEVLPGNIGYIKLDMFHHSREAQQTAAAALAFVAHCDALIFDLRQNHGGSPEMIQFICSYLFHSPTHLNSFYDRLTGQTSETWTVDNIPGERFDPGLRVYVLTSSLTFSAGEEFTYDLKHLGRATIVGETTGGGAHPVTERIIADRFQMRVPYAKAVNPVTKTNWEGVGVIPHIAVPATDALDAACRDAAKKISAKRQPHDG